MTRDGRAKSLLERWDSYGIPLPVLIRWALAGYFLYSGYAKIGDPVVFLKNIRLYGALPEEPAIFLNATAVILPWLEIVCGLALLLGVMTRGAAINLALMLAVFTPAILFRSLAIRQEQGISFFDVEFDCGCGSGAQIIWIKLCKNTGLFLGAVVTIISRCQRFSLSALWGGQRSDEGRTTCPTSRSTADLQG